MPFALHRLAAACAFPLLLASGPVWSQITPGQGKLLLTGGISSVDGAAGGGLTPWAVTGSHATAGEIGVTAHVTRVSTQDYALGTYGITVGLLDRLEVSLARQDFDTRSRLAPLSPAFNGLHLKQDILGLKLRLAGDAVLDSDRWMPQIAAGVLHKRLNAGPLTMTR